MDSRSTPYRSEVARWSPNDLADFFRRLNFKDCEKVVRKHNITGQRFLSMSENDIQKFPKLKVPILSKLSQEINRHEEKKSIFPKRPQIQKSPENTGYIPTSSPSIFFLVILLLQLRMSSEYKQEECDGWSSFDESDDYESPDDDQEGDGVDYETPNDQDGVGDENDADYEPPPSNDEDILRNAIFPPKPIPATSEYIDRPATERGKTSLQPPVPPQRPGPSPVPGASRSRSHGQTPVSSSSSNENYREKNASFFKAPAPFVDRSKKPPLDRPGPHFERESLGAGKRDFPDMVLTSKIRTLAEDLAKIQKPPLPPTERYEKNSPSSRRVLPPPKSNQMPDRQLEMEPDNILQRPVPQPSLQSFNTFPSRTTRSQSNLVPLPPKMKPDLYTESVSSTVSLPPRLLPSNISRNFSKIPADGRPPLPIPTRPNAELPKADNEGVEQCHKTLKRRKNVAERGGKMKKMPLDMGQPNQKWYVADITRSDAEVALRNINKDGAFLVRDSSKKRVEQPFVLMVLYHNKVYNIQIRYQQEDQVYFLGTSLKGNEDFTSVADIVDYFTRMPLLLIDGKDRCSKKQCMLTYAAGAL